MQGSRTAVFQDDNLLYSPSQRKLGANYYDLIASSSDCLPMWSRSPVGAGPPRDQIISVFTNGCPFCQQPFNFRIGTGTGTELRWLSTPPHQQQTNKKPDEHLKKIKMRIEFKHSNFLLVCCLHIIVNLPSQILVYSPVTVLRGAP